VQPRYNHLLLVCLKSFVHLGMPSLNLYHLGNLFEFCFLRHHVIVHRDDDGYVVRTEVMRTREITQRVKERNLWQVTVPKL
jgi:hypothetical protein